MFARALSRLPFVQELRSRRRRTAVDAALIQVARLVPRQAPSRALIAQVHRAWGNPEFTASISYLEAAASRALELGGDILECGSGLSTLLLGVLADINGFHVWTLEHDRQWADTIEERLKHRNIRNVHLRFAPLRDYGHGVSWYDAPFAELPNAFSLVICDGPPNWKTPGGRYGLLMAMRERLAPSWNILLDDPNAAEKTGMLARLRAEPGVTVSSHVFTDAGFLWVTRDRGANAS